MKGGVTYSCVLEMSVADREHMLAKLWKQLKLEREEQRKAAAAAKKKRRSRKR